MSSTASGTSRRSHTKSRKGCKTCKKRHIRCDESYPQCRNCTKHHCRCDYMDATSVDDIPEQAFAPSFLSTSEIESAIHEWQRTGVARVDELSMDLNAQNMDFSANDMRLLYHILRAGQSNESGKYTIWTDSFPQAMTAAIAHPFLMHAAFSFTAFTLAFETGSADAKGLAYHYGGIALHGLHQAITQFSRENADAVLIASRLLAWQANDWHSWVSLTSGIRTVVDSIWNVRHASTIPHIIEQEQASIPADFPSPNRTPVTDDFSSFYASVLQQCLTFCDGLTPYLAGRGQDIRFIEQLRDYLRRLLGITPAENPEEQFNHLYVLRKWLFYVPIISLRSPGKDFVTLIVMAYYYAVCLEMEPLFPDVARAFCSGLAATPLREILEAFDQRAARNPADESLPIHMTLLAFPRQAMAAHQARAQERRHSHISESVQNFEGFGEQLFSMENQGISAQRSPGFIPQASRTASSTSGSMYLDVPTLASDVSQEYSSTGLGLPMSTEPVEMSFGEMSLELPGGEHYAQRRYGPYDPSASGESSR